MPTLEKMIDGFKVYKATVHEKYKDTIAHQVRAGVKPSTLIITSSDLPIAPNALISSAPGELYVIRLKSGLVPSYRPDWVSGFTATLEYAVLGLQVKNIVVLGQSQEDGLQMLLDGILTTPETEGGGGLRKWLSIAGEVSDAVRTQLSQYSRAEQERAMELETIVLCIRNLFSYPWIESRINNGSLEIYGWHFDIESGALLGYMPSQGTFVPFE